MGLYNFHRRFVPFIKNGTKKHTIRAERCHPDKAGNTLHLYQGLRTKKAKLIKRVECVKIEQIYIYRDFQTEVEIAGVPLTVSEKESLARRDGFKDFAEMMDFWCGRLPFHGQIIHWK